jgi:hypothetical protein
MQAPKNSAQFVALLMPPLMLLLCSCSTTQVNPVQDAAVRARIASVKKVAILKPDVQIERKKYAGEFEPQLDEDQAVATRLEPLVVDQFMQRGFTAGDAKLPAATGQMIQSAYDQINYVTERKLEHPTMESAFSLGAEFTTTTSKLGAQAVVFVNLRAWARSGAGSATELALKALLAAGTGVVISKSDSAQALLVLVLVDGKTGEIIWWGQGFESWGLGVPDFGTDDLANLVTKALAQFPGEERSGTPNISN